MPAAEVDITAELVRALLEEQHPDLAGSPLRVGANGWDNVLFRIGDELCARLPRRQLGAPLVEHELRWLPELAPHLPIPIPAPVRAGRPSEVLGYPWSWSIVRWVDGTPAIEQPPLDWDRAARDLADFLVALHQPAPADAPHNPWRGIPLAERVQVDVDEHLRATWTEALHAPRWDGPPVWIHGDLHPGNIVVADRRIAAVVDFGDMTAGDPATDYAVAWMLFPAQYRDVLRATTDSDTWRRAKGWALHCWGLSMLKNSADNPPYADLALRILDAVVTS